MKRIKQVLVGLTLVGLVVVTTTVSAHPRHEETVCDKGVMINGVCRVITDCVYGDSLPPEACAKFEKPTETEQPVVQPTTPPVEYSNPVDVTDWGK